MIDSVKSGKMSVDAAPDDTSGILPDRMQTHRTGSSILSIDYLGLRLPLRGNDNNSIVILEFEVYVPGLGQAFLFGQLDLRALQIRPAKLDRREKFSKLRQANLL